MMDLVAEVRHGARMLVTHRGFTAVAVLTLAIGIGANTAIFSVVDGVLLKPFPYPEEDRLLALWERNLARGFQAMFVAPPNFADWRERTTSFEDIAAFTTGDVTLMADAPERIRQGRVSASLFPVLGVEPASGRWFTEEEDAPGAGGIVVVSAGFAERRFGTSAAVVGQRLVLDGEPHTVIGVMPRGFFFPPPIALEGDTPAESVELWTPLALDEASGSRGAHYLNVIGRLREGVTLGSALSEMNGIARNLAEAYPSSNEGWDVAMVPLVEQVTGGVRSALLVLSGAVGLVLLIACVNVANLLLTRGVARQREMAIRAALGAGRNRLVQQLLIESLLLAALGGVLGLIFAIWGVRTVVALAPANLPRLAEITFDGTAAGFTAVACLGAAVLFGLVPALAASSGNLIDGLRERDPRAASRRSSVIGRGLVVAEVALALVLLVAAALLIRSFANLRSVDPGFTAQNVITVRTTLPRTAYEDREARVGFVDRAIGALAVLPGVDAVGAINEMPLTHDRQGTSVVVEGEPAPPSGQEPQTNFAVVSPGYFQSMGIPLLRGRDFNVRDTAERPRVVVINEALARRHFADENPLGRRIVLGMTSSDPFEIVGVVGDVRHRELSETPSPNAYVTYAQQPRSFGLTFVIRSSSEPASVLPSVRSAIRNLDASLPLFDVEPLAAVLAKATAEQGFSTRLLTVFALSALILACIGLYGVMSYTVSQRVPEMGLRMALGAAPVDISKLVLSKGARLAGVGIGIGLAGALALTRVLSSLLYQVESHDALSFVLVGAALFVVALTAAYVPARRAARLDPMEALRCE